MGFQGPNLLEQISHLVASDPLEKNKSNGFHPKSGSVAGADVGVSEPLLEPFFAGFAPGLRIVKR